MKKINAVSDKENIQRGEFISADLLWRASRWLRSKKVELRSLDLDPSPEELLGFAILVSRRRKKLTRLQFVERIGCSLEELLALEAGVLPMDFAAKYLSAIMNELEMKSTLYQTFQHRFKLA